MRALVKILPTAINFTHFPQRILFVLGIVITPIANKILCILLVIFGIQYSNRGPNAVFFSVFCISVVIIRSIRRNIEQ